MGLWAAGLGRARLRGLRALDRLGLTAQRDLDLARLMLLGLGDPHLEHPVLEAGLDAVGVHALGQRQRARERAERTLDPVIALVALLVLGLALARDRQDVVLELDLYVALGQAGQIGPEYEVILGLDDVHGGNPAARDRLATAVARRRRIEERVEQPVHLVLHGLELADR